MHKLLFFMVVSLSFCAHALDDKRVAELDYMLRQDCGSCHGMRLTGGLGPALTKKALKGKSDEYLRVTIKKGHPGTPMPPWEAILSDEDIQWMVTTISQFEAQ